MTDMKLITIPFSHYCEKARWALELGQFDFEEEGHLPLLHYPYLKRYRAGNSVPVLITEKAVIRDSTFIVRYLSGREDCAFNFYPGDIVQHTLIQELEDTFDKMLGPHSRRWFYYYALQNPHMIIDSLQNSVPPLEVKILTKQFKLWARAIGNGLKITPDSAERSLQKVRAVFNQVESLLADGRAFLSGDTFSAADISFAALGAPVVVPANYGFPMPPLDALPKALLDIVYEFRERKAGQYLLSLYREHRPRSIYQGYQPGSNSIPSRHLDYQFHHTGIYYIEKGAGPTIIFLHGNGANASLYLPLIELLAQEFRVIAPDLPGYGHSVSLKKPKLDNYLERLELFIASMVNEPFDLIGHSLGGFLSWGLVKRRSNWIKRMIWMEAAIFDNIPLKYKALLLGVAKKLRHVNRHSYEDIFQRVDYLSWDSEESHLDMLNQFMVSYINSCRLTQAGFIGHYPFIKHWNLEQIEQPVLCIRGEKDTLVSQASNRLAELLPNGKLCTIPNAGHFLVGENDEALVKAITDFLAVPADALK